MKLSHFSELIEEIKREPFCFHGIIGTLSAFRSCKEYYWQILINHKFDSKENVPYVKIQFDLRLNQTEFQFDSINRSFNSVEECLSCARDMFIARIGNLEANITKS